MSWPQKSGGWIRDDHFWHPRVLAATLIILSLGARGEADMRWNSAEQIFVASRCAIDQTALP